MRKLRNTILVSMVLLHAITFPAQAAIFATSDLEGTMNFHNLISGDFPQWIGWVYGTQSFDAAGNCTFTSITRSNGDSSLPSNITIAVSPSGVLTIPGTDYHGIMNSHMGVGVMTDGGGGYALVVGWKQGASTYNTSDLEGTWNFHFLTSGDSPQYTGWGYGTQNVDASGNLTFTSITRSNGDSTLPSDETLAISSSGIVTMAGSDLHGVMNYQKDMIVFTMTDGGGGYGLGILLKRGTATYSTSDLEGTWDFHMLASGDYPQWVGWIYGTQDIDDSGNLTFTSITRSDGDTTLPSNETLAISSSGVLTMDGSNFHGVMNPQKDMVVAVMTDGGDGYDLIVSVRGARTISGYTFASNSATFANQYFPAAVGSRWVYRGYGAYNGNTKTIDALSTEIIYGVSCLKGKIQDPVEGIRYFWGAEDTENNIHIFRLQYESQPALEVDSDDDIPNNIQLIGSPGVGNSWSRSINGAGIAEFEVMSLTATADGYDNCLKVKVAYGQGPDIDYEYFKAGVGLVKTESENDGGSWVLTKIPGDFCGANSDQPDGYVDYWDLLYFAQRWHTDPGDTNWDPRCDLDKEDNYVDVWDLMVFADHWHEGVKP